MKKQHQNFVAEVEQQEYKNAVKALRAAEINFNNAEPEFVELANAELTTARMRVDTMNRMVSICD